MCMVMRLHESTIMNSHYNSDKWRLCGIADRTFFQWSYRCAPYAMCLFLFWYWYAIHWHLHLNLSLITGSIALFIIALGSTSRTRVLWYIPVGIILFNVLHHWLPWPSVKPAIVMAGAVICSTVWCRNSVASVASRPFHRDVCIFLVCLLIALLLSIQGVVVWNEAAARNDLWHHLSLAPLLDDNNLFISLRYLFMWGLVLCFYWALTQRLRALRDIHVLLHMVVLAATIASIFGIYSYTNSVYMVGQYMYERRINATCTSPAVLADILTVALISAGYLILVMRNRLYTLYLLACVLIMCAALFLTGCRTNVVLIAGCAVGFGLYCLYRMSWRRRLYWIVGGCAALIVIGAVISGVPALRVRVYDLQIIRRLLQWRTFLTRDNFLQYLLLGRWDHWYGARRMFMQTPLWGAGAGMFEQDYALFRHSRDVFVRARVHNVPLRVLTENGSIVGIALLVILCRITWRFVRILRAKDDERVPSAIRRLVWMLAYVCVVCLISSLFSDVFYTDSEALLFLAMYAAIAQWAFARCALSPSTMMTRVTDMWQSREKSMQRFFRYNEWLRLSKMSLGTACAVSFTIVLIILTCVGIHEAQRIRDFRLENRAITYGLRRLREFDRQDTPLFIMGKDASIPTHVTTPALALYYRAAHPRMLGKDLYLTVYVNDIKAIRLPLDTLTLRALMWDVRKLQGEHVTFSYRVTSAYVPRKEGWFADNHTYGAVVSLPINVTQDPQDHAQRIKRDWHVRWSTTPLWYHETDVVRTVYE